MVGAGWDGQVWAPCNSQCQTGSAERWLSGRDNSPPVTSHISNPQIRMCISPHQKQSAFMPFFFFFNLEIWFLKHFVFLPRYLLHVIFQVVSVRTPLLSPARSPHGTQLQTQPLQLGWLDSQHPKTQSSLNPIPVKVLAAPELLPAPSSAGFSP